MIFTSINQCNALTQIFLKNSNEMHRFGIKSHFVRIAMKAPEGNVQAQPPKVSEPVSLITCRICYRPFPNKRSLTQHLMTHRGKRNFYCRFCGKAFLHLLNRKCHERTHLESLQNGHSNFKDVAVKSGDVMSDEKTTDPEDSYLASICADPRYNCKRCGKSFHFRSYLEKHMMIHTTKKTILLLQNHNPETREDTKESFRCSFCEQTFQSHEIWTTHQMSHERVNNSRILKTGSLSDSGEKTENDETEQDSTEVLQCGSNINRIFAKPFEQAQNPKVGSENTEFRGRESSPSAFVVLSGVANHVPVESCSRGTSCKSEETLENGVHVLSVPIMDFGMGSGSATEFDLLSVKEENRACSPNDLQMENCILPDRFLESESDSTYALRMVKTEYSD